MMLLIITLRLMKGHFKPESHFGFEGVAWYWHFVDVVWVGLFITSCIGSAMRQKRAGPPRRLFFNSAWLFLMAAFGISLMRIYPAHGRISSDEQHQGDRQPYR